MLYFAYGSNLDTAQMARRCPSAKLVGAAVLNRHALCFTGFSASWGGAVASVVRKPGWRTPGLLYSLSPRDLRSLDTFEGHPYVYERVTRQVDIGGRKVRAILYVHRPSASTVPGPDYLRVIKRAYKRFGFDSQPLLLAAWGYT